MPSSSSLRGKPIWPSGEIEEDEALTPLDLWYDITVQFDEAKANAQASLAAMIAVMELYVLTGQRVQKLLDKCQEYSISERAGQLQRAHLIFDNIMQAFSHFEGGVCSQPPSNGPDELTRFGSTLQGPKLEDIMWLRGQCDMFSTSIRVRMDEATRGHQNWRVCSNGMLREASPVEYGGKEWRKDMSLDINRMLRMAHPVPTMTEQGAATLRQDRSAPEGESTSSRSEMPTSSAAWMGVAASRLPANTFQQPDATKKIQKKGRKITSRPNPTLPRVQPEAVVIPTSLTHALQHGLPDLGVGKNASSKNNGTDMTESQARRPAKLPAVENSRQQELPAAKPAAPVQNSPAEAVPTQTQASHPLQLARSSPVPLPLPTDVSKLPSFKRKKHQDEFKPGVQTGKVCEQKPTTDPEALLRQGASPRAIQPRQVASATSSTLLPKSEMTPTPPITPRSTPRENKPVTSSGQKRLASSSSETSSGAGLQERYKKQRTGRVGPDAPNHGAHQPQVASLSRRLAAAGNGSRAPASLPPKPPVSLPTSQEMSAATQMGPSQQNYVRYRQPAPASSLQRYPLPTLSNAPGSTGFEAARARGGYQLVGQGPSYGHVHQVQGPHTSSAVSGSLPAVDVSLYGGTFPTGHWQPPRGP